jgi:uncharacterized membrane protein YgaE (UPF0421/DUF939 family)
MKRIYEGASVLAAILFVIGIGVGFFFKTKGFIDEHKQLKHHEKRMEKAKKKNRDSSQRYKEAADAEIDEIMRKAQEQIEEEKRKIEGCHIEDHAVIQAWERYYLNLNEYNRDKRDFDRGNEIKVPPPPLNYEPAHPHESKDNSD